MKKSDIKTMPPFFDRYINLADDKNVVDVLQDQLEIDLIYTQACETLQDRTYAEGKWTIKDIFQHVIDNERIQAYRALRFARGDESPLPGYEEAAYGQSAKAKWRDTDALLEEFEYVRKGTIALFKSFDREMLFREGICYNIKISVLALGFVMAGHQIHHLNIIRERYLPLL